MVYGVILTAIGAVVAAAFWSVAPWVFGPLAVVLIVVALVLGYLTYTGLNDEIITRRAECTSKAEENAAHVVHVGSLQAEVDALLADNERLENEVNAQKSRYDQLVAETVTAFNGYAEDANKIAKAWAASVQKATAVNRLKEWQESTNIFANLVVLAFSEKVLGGGR